MVVGLKIVRDDFGSLTDTYGRVFYPMGEWVEVPEPGAFVAIRNGLLSAGDGARCIYLECEGKRIKTWIDGVYCFERVRHIPPCPEKINPRLREIAKLWEVPFDEGAAKFLVENSFDSEAIISALRRISDQSFLEKVAIGDFPHYVKTLAIKLLTDTGIILRLTNKKRDIDVRIEAISKIEDQDILEMLSYDSSDEVRLVALKNLTIKHRIYEMANGDKNSQVRYYACRKLKELGGTK